MNSKLTKCLLVLLVMLISTLTGFSQKTVTGKVIDPDGKPVEAATIGIKGTNTNVTTDAAGSFSISVPSNQAVLKFSSAGFTYAEVNVGNR